MGKGGIVVGDIYMNIYVCINVYGCVMPLLTQNAGQHCTVEKS